MLLVAFVPMRSNEQRRLESETALRTARRQHKLTLKSGGARLTLSDGTVAPGSRRYREQLAIAIDAAARRSIGSGKGYSGGVNEAAGSA
jgi:hypothetical protein